MNISFAFKNFEPSEHLKKYSRRRMEKLSRFLGKAGTVEAIVVMSVDKFRHTIEVTITGDNLNISAVETTEEMYSSVDLIMAKLESQVKKYAGKIKEHARGTHHNIDVFSFSTEGMDADRVIIGEKHFESRPMPVEEAVIILEKLDDDFLVFMNVETERVNVLYKRKNGKYGLITPSY